MNLQLQWSCPFLCLPTTPALGPALTTTCTVLLPAVLQLSALPTLLFLALRSGHAAPCHPHLKDTVAVIPFFELSPGG